MSMNLFEKIVTISTLTGSVLFMGVMYFKGNRKEQKHDAFKVRQQLLKQDHIKMLYSTMSFFYLQGFHSKSLESFYTMKKILDIEKPNLIVLPISRQEYDQKYIKVIKNPKFREAMDKFTHNLKTKNDEQILNMKDLELANLEKLYLIDYCNQIKKCKLVFARKPKQYYKNMLESYQKNQPNNPQQSNKNKIANVKIEDYTQSLILQMKPKLTFNILPESPYKIIYGIIEPEYVSKTALKWKLKFKQNYDHEVIEDEQVLERQRLNNESKGGSYY